ncbi:hypothetical protein SAMN05443550_105298 [Pedobacter hartonius]|uniref:Uncharacterized protein n=2 Tax=Pedobacter hartonius TaxID=425514 RepID=A0A1H4EA30_9SPHI|nr:hypothetical protein SAMN05443550_105298 [Pedobacter hartonius]
MAIQKYGPFGPFSGKLGNVIGYIDQKGQQRLRTVGEHKFMNPSVRLRETWLKTSLTTAFLKPVTEFIRMGFAAQAKSEGMSAYNLAASVTRKAITGTYPDLQIDFSKVLFSSGMMPVAREPETIAVDGGLMFSWDHTRLENGTRAGDQVMLMAYFPGSSKAVFLRSGAKRSQGYEFLSLPVLAEQEPVETYISFISEDHSSISNSIYTRQILWGSVK